MAGDWIKMRVDLQTHPKIVRILSATRADKFRVVGGLHAVWSIFDTHSEDGKLKGYTPELLDHVIGWEGFSRAMESVGWLAFDGLETLALPEFDAHNGQSGKRRAEDQKRKRDGRKKGGECPIPVRTDAGQIADKLRTREEKRREEEDQKLLSSADDQCPHAEILSLYHELLPANPRMKVWAGKRQSALRARWREDTKRQSLDYWRRFFAHVAASRFLTGRASGKDGRTFLPGLDWLVLPENFAKVIEGRYHDQEAA